jgi:disulfide bond formation protein DsbB
MSEAMAARNLSAVSSPASTARWIALLLPLALLGGALGSQYLGGLHPCEMCYWQRYPHAAAIVLAALSFTAPANSGASRSLTLLAALAIAVSGCIGVYHAGVEAKIFEGLTTCTALPKGLSTAEMLKEITQAPLVRCDEVQFRFLGI